MLLTYYPSFDGERSVESLSGAAAIWLASTVAAHLFLVVFGMIKVRSGGGDGSKREKGLPRLPMEVLVPVKGSFPGIEEALVSLLMQDHPDYRVIFIVESEDDPVTPLVERFCTRYSHARKVISGPATSCAQKNHSLVAGAKSLRPKTRIIVTADSTNVAHPDWLRRLVSPIEASEWEVVTTFRAFIPHPETLGGVCKAIYAAYVFLTAFIVARSIFRTYVIWHGRKYWAGSGGVVRRVDFLP